MLQPLGQERFLMLVGNWYRLNRGKFKVPTFAHRELDLYRVFWEVQARGGSDVVTAEKLWKVGYPLCFPNGTWPLHRRKAVEGKYVLGSPSSSRPLHC